MAKHWIDYEITIIEKVWVETETPEEAIEKAADKGFFELSEGNWELLNSKIEISKT